MTMFLKKLPDWVANISIVTSGFSLFTIGFIIFISELIEWNDILMAPFYTTGYGFTIYFFIICLKIIIELILTFSIYDSIIRIIRGTNGF